MHFGAFGANQDTKNTDAWSHEQNGDSPIVPDDNKIFSRLVLRNALTTSNYVEQIEVSFFIFYNIYCTFHTFHISLLTDQMKGCMSNSQLLSRYLQRITATREQESTMGEKQCLSIT